MCQCKKDRKILDVDQLVEIPGQVFCDTDLGVESRRLSSVAPNFGPALGSGSFSIRNASNR